MLRYMRLMAVAVVAAIAALSSGESTAQNRPWGEDYIPNLTVTTQNGKPVHFYDDLVKGKIVIISFIYTSCTDICPLTTARMAQLEEKLGDLVGRDVFMLSMTVDPERDTPERLKEYSERFQAGPGWSFVTGKPEDIRAINYKFGERSKLLSEHRNEIVLGNDATGEWQKD
jgi:protein SCO1/2